MPNRLANESSPYLLQHADNPVDWYPWGEEALTRAKTEDKPIFLSIGYAACHWCHVMAHESFEDPETARLMNELFINIKVDREERPDLDTIYMDAVVAMTGHGGWPMSVFLTPDGVPFYGGTYFPPTPRHGLPAFRQVLESVARAYHTQKETIARNGQALLSRLQAAILLQSTDPLDPAVPDRAASALAGSFDRLHGGLRGAPKFPQPMTWEFLLHHYHRTRQVDRLEMVELTLQQMAYGGMYDQLGGGFHRYSVDSVWLVPHFEKMLYDNALLARLYLHTYQMTGNPLYRRIVEETLDYVLREMTHPAGGFFATQDADSEGEEGKFFLWTPEEIQAVLGREEGELFCRVYGVTPGGNFEGRTILNLSAPDVQALPGGMDRENLVDTLAASRKKLFAAREQRVKPARDEKIITAWNGLMLAALAEAGRVLHRDDYTQAAVRNAQFVLDTMMSDGRLYRTWRDGHGPARFNGYLEDYAFYADGLLALYQTTFNPRWFHQAQALMETVLARFTDAENGGFFDVPDDHERLATRPKSLQDNATPCGSSMAVRVLLHLAALTGEERFYQPAVQSLAAIQHALAQYPAAFGHWLSGLEFALSDPQEVAVIGPPQRADTRALVEVVVQAYRPNLVLAVSAEEEAGQHPPLAHHRQMVEGQAAAYVCRRFVCQQPVTAPEELAARLD